LALEERTTHHDGQRYILAKKIARGGMAEIFLGKQIGEDGFQRLCAIKRILPHYSQDKEFIEMFRDEAHICKRLQHANIVRVEGFEEVEGSYAIIMEYVNGSDLRSILSTCEKSQQRLDIPMALFIVAEAARGLHYAHTKVDEITQQALGIVHRDISPQNILLSFEGEVKITDFGIADADNKLTETKPGIVKGKYSYMSPEQISAKQVDARTDVFALAIVLWEMLSMKRLFQGENEVETIQLVKNCKINFKLHEYNPKIDEELEKIVARGLSKDPRKRYVTAAALEKDLRKYLSVKYPEFTVHELGNFLKRLLDKQRAESASDIKKILTETNQRPTPKKLQGRKRHIDLEAPDEKSSRSIGVVRSTSSGVAQQRQRAQTAGRPGTGLNGQRRGSGRSSANLRRGRHENKLFYFLMSVAAVTALAIYFLYSPQPQQAQLMIKTTPPRVRISINGEWIDEGRYQKTPMAFNINPNKAYTFRFERNGYAAEKLQFSGDGGTQPTQRSMVLNRVAPISPVKIRVIPADRALTLDIDQGFVRQIYKKQQKSMLVNDLSLGRNHTLRVFSGVDDKKPPLFACSFVPKNRSWTDPVVVTVNLDTQRCTVDQ
jgi:serine/threonine protein kinase